MQDAQRALGAQVLQFWSCCPVRLGHYSRPKAMLGSLLEFSCAGGILCSVPCLRWWHTCGKGTAQPGPRGHFCVHPRGPEPLPSVPQPQGQRLQESCWQLAERNGGFSVAASDLKERAVFPALSVSMAASLAACAGVSATLGNFQGVMEECWTLHFLISTCSFKCLNR